jgi:hypothetical protein
MADEMLRQLVANQAEKILYLGLDVLAMRTCLLDSKIISQDDYNAAVKKVHADAKAQLQALRDQFGMGKQN